MDAKLKLAGLLGAAVLAIPGAGLITNAVAADGSSSSTTTEQEAPLFEPAQSDEQQPDQPRPDRADCPEKDGDGSGSGGNGGSSGTSL
jgi:hypothetical protein